MNLKSFLFLILISAHTWAQNTPVHFTVEMQYPEKQEFQISMSAKFSPSAYIDLAIPAWSPGYYQIMDFGKNVTTFNPKNQKGESLRWVKFDNNTWRVYTNFAENLLIDYTVKADRNFVGTAYLDASRAFIKPSALFLYPVGKLNTPVTLAVKPQQGWDKIATGLNNVKGKELEFEAPDYDIFFDSPLLVGKLQELPSFDLKGKKHRFLGYEMGEFDGKQLMSDLEKVIKVSTDLFNDIPYEHYTFIGIGPGNGGIEQLNSTAVAFTGESLKGPGRTRTLSFLTHEYFHHFNAKRIRPIELGPFNYNAPNRTNSLWVAEGLTAYYENIIMNRAGLLSRDEMLKAWGGNIARFQKNEGRKNQSLAESSAKTWEDGPFGKKGETISYYEKGPLVGMLLEIRIRTATGNKKSLDDVMRILYHDFYKKQNRGFTDEEMIKTCESVAGTSLDDIFQYVYSTNELDYKKYFAQVGINVGENFELTIIDKPTKLQQTILDDLFRK